jgi:hypothetical protein
VSRPLELGGYTPFFSLVYSCRILKSISAHADTPMLYVIVWFLRLRFYSLGIEDLRLNR